MPSFFGLKLGGDKGDRGDKSDKKKSRGRGFSISAPKVHSKDIHDLAAQDAPIPPVPTGLFTAQARPGSSQSQKLFSRKSKFFQYGSSIGASSMANLPRPPLNESPLPSPNFLRPVTSNPNMNMQWKNGSTTSLVPPSRPKNAPTPLGITRGQQPLTPNSLASPTSLASPASVSTPKSPLGAYELKLNLPSEGVSSFGEFDDLMKAPEPLRIRKQTPSPQPSADRIQPISKPPSPPGSVMTAFTDDASLSELPRSRGQAAGTRSLKRVDSNQTYGSSRKDIESPIEPIILDRSAYPTPPMSVARESEERPSPASIEQVSEQPVIQNVRGKRDTMIVKPTRRMSFDKYVEDFNLSILSGSKDPSGPPPAIPPKRADRPPPLNLNIRSDLVVQAAPHSAPLGLSQRPLLAKSESRRRPPQAAPPLSARPYVAPPQQEKSKHIRPSVVDYGLFPGDEYDEMEEDRPLTPDSPLLPLSGPLASPWLSSNVEEEPEDPVERMKNFRFPAVRPASPPPPLSAPGRNYQPESPIRDSTSLSNWPLPSPSANMSMEPLDPPPKMPGTAEPRMRSFSRPLTPKKELPHLPLHASPESYQSSVYPSMASQTNFVDPDSKAGFI